MSLWFPFLFFTFILPNFIVLNEPSEPPEFHNSLYESELIEIFGVDHHDKVLNSYRLSNFRKITGEAESRLIYQKFNNRSFRQSRSLGSSAQKNYIVPLYYTLSGQKINNGNLRNNIKIELIPNNAILSPTASLSIVTSTGNSHDASNLLNSSFYEATVYNRHFHGVILGNKNGHAALSIFEDKVIGTLWYGRKRYGIRSIPQRLKNNQTFLTRLKLGAESDIHDTIFLIEENNVKSIGLNPLRDYVIQNNTDRVGREKRQFPDENQPAVNHYAATMGENYLKIEIGLFIDPWAIKTKLVNGDRDAVLRYIITMWNEIGLYYRHPSIGKLYVDLTIVHITYIEEQPPGLVIDPITGIYLGSFCKYQSKLPNRKEWDAAVMITGLDIEDETHNKGVAGIAHINTMCSLVYSCSLIEGFRNGYYMQKPGAHELGHNLGLNHDEKFGDKSGPCIAKGYVMRAMNARTYEFWSPCSRDFLAGHIKTFECLMVDNTPQKDKSGRSASGKDTAWDLKNSLPGQRVSLDEQCRFGHNVGYHAPRSVEGSKERMEEGYCQSVKCSVDLAGSFISYKLGPALEGTYCGPQAWCLNGMCQPIGDHTPGNTNTSWIFDRTNIRTPDPGDTVDGGYSVWKQSPEYRVDVLEKIVSDMNHEAPVKDIPPACTDSCLKGGIPTMVWSSTCSSPYTNGGKYCDQGFMRRHITQCVPEVKDSCRTYVTPSEYDATFCWDLARKNPDWKLDHTDRVNDLAGCFYECKTKAASLPPQATYDIHKYFPDGTPCQTDDNGNEGTTKKFCLNRQCTTLPQSPPDFSITPPKLIPKLAAPKPTVKVTAASTPKSPPYQSNPPITTPELWPIITPITRRGAKFTSGSTPALSSITLPEFPDVSLVPMENLTITPHPSLIPESTSNTKVPPPKLTTHPGSSRGLGNATKTTTPKKPKSYGPWGVGRFDEILNLTFPTEPTKRHGGYKIHGLDRTRSPNGTDYDGGDDEDLSPNEVAKARARASDKKLWVWVLVGVAVAVVLVAASLLACYVMGKHARGDVGNVEPAEAGANLSAAATDDDGSSGRKVGGGPKGWPYYEPYVVDKGLEFTGYEAAYDEYREEVGPDYSAYGVQDYDNQDGSTNYQSSAYAPEPSQVPYTNPYPYKAY